MFGLSSEKKPDLPWHSQSLDENMLSGLKAFAQLLGYIRYFHPSDQAASTDWDRFAIDGVHKMQNHGASTRTALTSADGLVACLQELFEPVAPTLKISKVGDKPVPNRQSGIPTPGPEHDAVMQSLESTSTAGSGILHQVWWHHHGLGGSSPFAAYVSERVITSIPAGSTSEPGADPIASFAGELSPTVSFIMPVRLHGDAQGTLPHRPVATRDANQSTISVGDWQVRVATVVTCWNVLRHFYPYFDVVDVDWTTSLDAALVSAAAAADEPSFYDVLCTLISGLHDGHGAVGHIDHDEKQAFAPPIAWDWVENSLVITRVSSKSGAPSVTAGQVVLEIDGIDVQDAVVQASERVSGSTPESVRRKALQRLFGGTKDSSIKVKVQTADGLSTDQSWLRSYPMLITGTYTRSLEEPRPDKVADVGFGLFYIDLTRITDDDFRAALGRLERAKGIVFDLRGYPMFTSLSNTFIGHLIDSPVLSPHYLTPIREHPDPIECSYVWQRLRIEPAFPRLKARAVFLADTRAISYAETMLAFVKGNQIATIIGQRSAGCEGAPSFYQLPGGYTISWTSMRTLRHDGTVHQGKGIEPDIYVAPTREGILKGRDEILERALEELSG